MRPGEAELKKNEPALLEAKAQIDAGREQLDAVKAQLETGDSQLDAALAQLGGMRAELSKTEQKLKDEKDGLLAAFDKISGMQTSVIEYEKLQDEYKSARQALLSYDDISEDVINGDELLTAANSAARSMHVGYIVRFVLRVLMNLLMLASAAAGAAAMLKAFDKLKIKYPLWLIAAACAVGAILAESISLGLGRGLLYSALFVLIFAAALFALTFEKKQAAPAKAAQ